MKPTALILTFASLSLLTATSSADDAEQPRYIAEAPLPKGWPTPGPYNKVVEKRFPTYRAAYTPMGGENFAFWRLFRHIKRNDIPMTSPVEMGVQENEERLEMKSMGFLYQNTEVGKTGADGKKVEVRNVPAMQALSYTWQGAKSRNNLETAKLALDKALAAKKLESDDFRVLGYNGPGVRTPKKTWEMIAVIKK